MINATEIQVFVAKVRQKLADLSPAVVAELTDGLEADLTDRASEEGADFKLGTPTEYAAELRASAGLPGGTAARSGAARLVLGVWKLVAEFFTALLPAWWVARGIIIGAGLTWLWDGSFSPAGYLRIGAVVITLSVVLSVVIGLKSPRNALTRTASVLLAVVLMVGVAYPLQLLQTRMSDYNNLRGLAAGKVITWGGHYMGEVTAFDAKGNRLPMATLKSQFGWTIYHQSDFAFKGANGDGTAASAVIGMSIQDANDYLFKHGYRSAQFEYVKSTKPLATVVSAMEKTSDFGNVLVLKISQGK